MSKAKNKSRKSTYKKNKRNHVVLRIVVAVVVFAIAWFLGGKPMLKNDEGNWHFEKTEYPLVYTIQDFVKVKTDEILDIAAPKEKASVEEIVTEEEIEKSEAESTEGCENTTASEKSVSGSVKASSGTKGSNPSIDSGHSENNPLFLGNPSDALFDTSSGTNYLMEKNQYTVSYNTDTLCPNWVAWHLDSDDIGEADRSDDFRPDSQLPDGWYEITKADYQYNAYGFDRGHVCPSADRTATKEDNSMTFLMTNMVPQSPDNNRVIWMHFENYERQLVKEGNEVYIVAGPYGKGGTSGKGTFDSIPVTLKSGETLQMTVPAYTWKVCLVIPEGTDDISKINKDTTVIAINVPNKMGMGKTGDWEQFLTSIDEIENLTGYDFFELLPDDVEDVLESKVYVYNK